MENVYRIRLMFHIKSLKYVLIGFSTSFLVFCFLLFSPLVELNSEVFFFGTFSIFLMFFGPALYLHITYFIKNYGLKIIVDESQNIFKVVKSSKHISYSFSSIINVEQNLGLYYRNRIDRLGRRIAPWTPYGYLTIKLEDGLELHLTSLMINIQSPPFDITHTYFRFFPYLKKSVELSEKRQIANENCETEISFYKSNFKHYSKEQLIEKMRNEKTYEKAAVEAARQLLKSKFEKIV